jgi:large subunit ribosomal protein L17
MRHRVAHRKLGRVTEHRISMLRNQAQSLIRHERINTTVARAKELRPFVERLITIAKRGLAAGDNGGRAVHARRLVRRDVTDREVAAKLFDTIAPRFATRPGGYTRILRLGFRRGDNADIAQLELVGSEYNPAAATEKPAGQAGETPEAPKKKGMAGRLRAAADRIRGGKKTPEAEAEPGETKKARGQAKSTTVRKGASRGTKG